MKNTNKIKSRRQIRDESINEARQLRLEPLKKDQHVIFFHANETASEVPAEWVGKTMDECDPQKFSAVARRQS